MNDAMTIALWCWPAEVKPNMVKPKGEFSVIVFSVDDWSESELNRYGVHDAERILTERGLAEEYGRALERELSDSFDDDGEPTWADSARMATAPLDARVRAMAAVIRSL